jgi:hypothetical protein
VSQNPHMVQVPRGTEITYASGAIRVVAEPHDLVKKMLWPPMPPMPEVIPTPSLESQTFRKVPDPVLAKETPAPKKTAEPKTPPQGASDDPGSKAPASHSS